jgi:dTDP-4-dehydrorhamnose reductase
MRVVLLGSRGQLGAAVAFECRGLHDLVALDRAALDLTDADAVTSAMGRLAPDVIVNCAGNNLVDAAEDHQIEALQANAFAVRTLARCARAHGAVLVQYSSDFVFGGTVEKAHAEEDPLDPRSVYATSKMLGEWFAADAPSAYVLRVESLFGRAPGGPPPKGSVAGIVNGLLSGGAPTVFQDRTVSPTYVRDAAWATRELVERHAPFGLYHCVNSGACTWLEFAEEAARLLGVESRVVPVRVADVPLKASRPKYCALANDKLTSVGIRMPTWQDALARSLRDDPAHQPADCQ